MKEITIGKTKIIYDNRVVKILDSYEVTDEIEMKAILEYFKQQTKFKSKRTMKSWIKEWKSHNRLYRLGLFKEHTRDCDLEENEKIHRLIAYQILGIKENSNYE